jgi:hypothetical protein
VRLVDLKIVETGAQTGKSKLFKAIMGYRHGDKIKLENIRSACLTLSWLWKT